MALEELSPAEIEKLAAEKGFQSNFSKEEITDAIARHIAELPVKTLERLFNAGGAAPSYERTLLDALCAVDDALERARLLLDHGANLDARDGDTSPLDVVALNIYEPAAEFVDLLVDHGAQVNAVDDAGWTALHRAAWKNNAHAARALLRHGADRTLKTKKRLGEDAWFFVEDGPNTTPKNADARQIAEANQCEEVLAALDEVASGRPRGKKKSAASSGRAKKASTVEFPDQTTAYLIAGRRWPVDVTLAQARHMLEAASKRSKKRGPKIACAAGRDLSESGAAKADEDAAGPLVVGLEVQRVTADEDPSPGFALDALRTEVEQARQLPEELWNELEEIAGAPVEPVGLFLVCSGPLCSGGLAFGTPMELENAKAKKLKFEHGTEMNQIEHDRVIVGASVATVSASSNGAVAIDLSDAAHKARIAAAGALPGPAAYHLYASYD